MAEILSAAPVLSGAGVGGLLILLVLSLVKANRDDRAQHREIVAAVREEHRREVSALEAKIDRMEKRIDDLHGVIDTERGLRREAQDHAARAETRAATAEAHLAAMRRMTGGADEPATTWGPQMSTNHGLAPRAGPFVASVDDIGHGTARTVDGDT